MKHLWFLGMTLALAAALVLANGACGGGDGDADADSDADMDADGDGDADGDSDADGEDDADADGDADGDMEGDADGDETQDGDTDEPVVPECTTGGFSTLEGAAIEFPEQPCVFTLAEAAASVAIQYEVMIAGALNGVVPQPQDAGRCGRPGDSGLTVFEQLSGGGQNYCICDQGRCMPPDDDPVSLAAGVFPGSFVWEGVNWNGPSDTGNPPGAAFPPGTYTLRVSAVGQKDGADFEVVGTFELTLVP